MKKSDWVLMNRRNFVKTGMTTVVGLGVLGSLPFGNDLLFSGTSHAAAVKVDSPLGVITGATPIDQGMAISDQDFTIYNNKIAVSFAVGSNNYWNMTSGSILDIAHVKDGTIGTDLVNDVEFLNDLWTASGSFNNENLLKVPAKDVTWKKEANKIVVTAKTRYWTAGHKQPLSVVIEYTLEADKNYLLLKTTVTNPAGNEPYTNMHSGYSLSTLASSMFGPFGYYPDLKTTGIAIGADKDVNEKYGEFVVTYGKDYAVSVRLDGANAYKGSSGYKDVYILRTIEPGQTYSYSGELLVSDTCETAPILERYLDRDPSIASATVQGEVKDSSGKVIPNAYIIVSKEGGYKETVKSHGADKVKKNILQPLVWKMADKNGKFSMRLPQGEYKMHVEAAGYTPSDSQTVDLTSNKTLAFVVKDGAKAVFKVVDEKGKPVHAKVAVTGTTSTIKTLGGTVFFSDPKTHDISFNMPAPEKEVTFTVSRNTDFETLPVVVKRVVKPRETVTEKVVLPTLVQTGSRKWFSSDVHEHSDIGDGATPVAELYKAQLAAGLNIHAISDHDSVANNATLDKLAKGGSPFISSLEVSPGWGHWGILGVDHTKTPISPNLTPAEIIKAGHDMGALVVMNHPYSDYGFLNNRASVKGGNDKGSDDFDFIELQSTINLTDAKNMDKKALDAAMAYWTRGMKIYLSSGSDQHDVTSGLYPGIIRMYAFVDGKLDTRSYLKAMKAGNSYVTMGPIFTPAADSMFGSTKNVKAGQALTLTTELQAVHGLKSVEVYTADGKLVEKKEFDGSTKPVTFKATVKPEKDTWYNFVAIDGKGRYAVTNPVWVTVKK